MLKVDVAEVKANLSLYLEAAANGETVIICDRHVPVAELKGIAPKVTSPRPVGLAGDRFQVARAFFEPLPAALEDAFEGRS